MVVIGIIVSLLLCAVIVLLVVLLRHLMQAQDSLDGVGDGFRRVEDSIRSDAAGVRTAIDTGVSRVEESLRGDVRELRDALGEDVGRVGASLGDMERSITGELERTRDELRDGIRQDVERVGASVGTRIDGVERGVREEIERSRQEASQFNAELLEQLRASMRGSSESMTRALDDIAGALQTFNTAQTRKRSFGMLATGGVMVAAAALVVIAVMLILGWTDRGEQSNDRTPSVATENALDREDVAPLVAAIPDPALRTPLIPEDWIEPREEPAPTPAAPSAPHVAGAHTDDAPPPPTAPPAPPVPTGAAEDAEPIGVAGTPAVAPERFADHRSPDEPAIDEAPERVAPRQEARVTPDPFVDEAPAFEVAAGDAASAGEPLADRRPRSETQPERALSPEPGPALVESERESEPIEPPVPSDPPLSDPAPSEPVPSGPAPLAQPDPPAVDLEPGHETPTGASAEPSDVSPVVESHAEETTGADESDAALTLAALEGVDLPEEEAPSPRPDPAPSPATVAQRDTPADDPAPSAPPTARLSKPQVVEQVETATWVWGGFADAAEDGEPWTIEQCAEHLEILGRLTRGEVSDDVEERLVRLAQARIRGAVVRSLEQRIAGIQRELVAERAKIGGSTFDDRQIERSVGELERELGAIDRMLTGYVEGLPRAERSQWSRDFYDVRRKHAQVARLAATVARESQVADAGPR